MKNGFVFYSSFRETANKLQKGDRADFYEAIIEYSLTGIVPELTGIVDIVFTAIKTTLDNQIANYENGKKGGRPKKENPTNENEKEGFKNENNPPFENEKSYKDKDKDKEKEKEKDKEEEKETINKTNTIFSFDEFWETYNKKTGRVNCERIYARLKDKDYAKIKETLPIYLARLKDKDKKFQMNPQTYLNGKFWEDEVYQEAKKTEPTPSVPYEGFNPLSIDLSKLKPIR